MCHTFSVCLSRSAESAIEAISLALHNRTSVWHIALMFILMKNEDLQGYHIHVIQLQKLSKNVLKFLKQRFDLSIPKATDKFFSHKLGLIRVYLEKWQSSLFHTHAGFVTLKSQKFRKCN